MRLGHLNGFPSRQVPLISAYSGIFHPDFDGIYERQTYNSFQYFYFLAVASRDGRMNDLALRRASHARCFERVGFIRLAPKSKALEQAQVEELVLI
jgi:hypothetical protein